MNNPDIPLDELITHDAWLRALACRLVADEHAALDVVQDTWLTALTRPPRQVAALRSWMSQVVRHGVLSRHRADTHRREREAHAARAERLPSVEQLMDREALRLRVAQAVYALDEPYRSAIFFRYFEGLPPRKIARRLSESRPAVETRLKRGLQMLRVRLDREFGGPQGWHAALLPLIGLSPASAVPGAAASLAGALIMNTVWKIVLVAALVAATVLLVWPGDSGPDLEPGPVADRHEVAQESVPVAPAARSQAAAGPETPTPEKKTQPGPARAASPGPSGPDERPVVITGRSVDADTGDPLAGCVARVTAEPYRLRAVGGRHYEPAMEDHLVERGEIRWRDPEPCTTGPDGVFSLTFPCPPPVPVVVTLDRADRVPVEGRFAELRAGSERHLGDVPLAQGVTVSGRVVDTEGRAQVHALVQVYRFVPARALIQPPARFQTRTGENGLFCFPRPVPAGARKVRVVGRYLEGDPERTIPPHPARLELELVVQALPSITGVVLDDQSRPVAGAWVDFRPHGTGRRYFANQSAKDGTFRLERRTEDRAETVALIAAREGYEVVWQKGKYAWGTTGVQIVLARGLPVSLQVVDADTGRPVERFGVRCYSTLPDQARVHEPHRRLRHPGSHPGGTLELPGVRRGPNVLLVQPMDREHAPSAWHHFEVGPGGAAVQVVRLKRPVRHTVRVVRKDGSPVPGTSVKLLRPPDQAGEITLSTPAGKAGEFLKHGHDQLSLVLAEGTTNRKGEVVLQGPAGDALALCVEGPTHLPRMVNGVILVANGSPSRIEVEGGACIVGRIRPPLLLEKLRLMSPAASEPGHNPAGGAPAPINRPGPAIRLVQPGTRDTTFTTEGLEAPLDEDGRFVFSSVAPGTWDLMFSCILNLDGKLPINTAVNQRIHRVENLAMGETRRLDLDLSHLVPGRIEGTVFLNGQSMPGKPVTFAAAPPDGLIAAQQVPSRTVWTDDRGRYALALFPGVYQASVQLHDAPGLFGGDRVRSDESLAVVPGQLIVRDIHLRAGILRLQLVGSDGHTPLPDVEIVWRHQNRSRLTFTRPTGSDGRITLDPMPLGTFVILARPRALADGDAWRAYIREHRETWQQGLVQIGTLAVTTPSGPSAAGEPPVHTLIMPADSGY